MPTMKPAVPGCILLYGQSCYGRLILVEYRADDIYTRSQVPRFNVHSYRVLVSAFHNHRASEQIRDLYFDHGFRSVDRDGSGIGWIRINQHGNRVIDLIDTGRAAAHMTSQAGERIHRKRI